VRRTSLYLAAAVGLLVAILLAAARVGEQAGALSDWQALVLGMVQGLTELLPISSSGHLILVPWLADWRYLEAHPDFNKTFDVALHLGTLVAVIVYSGSDVVRYVGAWFRSIARRSVSGADERIAWYILAATIPAALAGAVGEEFIEKKLGQPWQIAILLAVFGVLLWLADRLPQQKTI
jgi:undecaprenyl-diphosphatase